MPDLAQTIIVSSGIAAGSPFTVGQIPLITQAGQSPLIANSMIRQVTDASALDGSVIIVGTNDVGGTTPHEELRTTGGFISEKRGNADSIIIGRLATVNNGSSIAIGATASASNAPAGIALGSGATQVGGGGVVIGTNAVQTNVSNLGAVCIGIGATGRDGHNGWVAIGDSAFSDSGVAIGSGVKDTSGGHRNVLIGTSLSMNAALTDCILIGGSDASSGNSSKGKANGQILIGTNITGPTTTGCVVINGDSNTTEIGTGGWQLGSRTYPLAICVLGAGDLSANNVNPANITIRTTNAQGTNVNGATMTIVGSLSTGTGVGGGIVFQTGVTGTTGTTLQTAATALTIADGTQIATLTKRLNMTETAATGANALTLTNGPASTTAGPPQFYIRFQVGGTNVVVPAWTG